MHRDCIESNEMCVLARTMQFLLFRNAVRKVHSIEAERATVCAQTVITATANRASV